MNQQNRNLFIGVGVLLVLLILGPILFGGTIGPGFGGRGMMGWGFTADGTSGNSWFWGLGMALGGLMMVGFWGVLIVGLVLFARWITGQPARGTGPGATEDPLTILRRRYAAGEIDRPTYERMQSELANATDRPREAVVANGRTENVR